MAGRKHWGMGMRPELRRWSARILQWILVFVLLGWALRGIPLADIGRVLGRLRVSQLIGLLALDLLILWSFSWRWWAVLRAQGHPVPSRFLALYRLAAFAVSYLTPGTQFGGEPLQIYLLSRRHSLPASTAIASVLLDKTLELIGNFTFLVIGIQVVLHLGLIPTTARTALVSLSVGLFLLPVLYLWLSCRGVGPATWLLRRFPVAARRWPGYRRLAEAVAGGEEQVGALCRGRSLWLVAAVGLTLVSWLAVLLGAWVAMRFIGISVSPAQAVGVLTAARLAFLLPVPGGLGALEASQVLAVSALGFSRADGVGLGLLIRARDLLFAGLGLWLGVVLAPGKRAGRKPAGPSDAA